MNKTIFISSTFEDLKNHRRKVWSLLEKYDVNIRGMEKFGARTETPIDTCLAEVEQSDIFVGIIGHKLGSIDPTTEKSFTQREYEHARKLRKAIFLYLMDEKDSKVSFQDIDFGERHEKLIAFKNVLKERHTIDFFISEDSLIEKLKTKFNEVLSPKKEENIEYLDEYDHAKEVVNKFLLLPKIYSGKDIKLNVKFAGEPFPASKQICSEFNLEYGATIGVKIIINKPSLSKEPADIVFITSQNVNNYFNLDNKEDLDIYAMLEFSENNIGNIKANFIREEYFVGGFASAANLFGSGIFTAALQGQKKIIEPEGKIILRLSNFINIPT